MVFYFYWNNYNKISINYLGSIYYLYNNCDISHLKEIVYQNLFYYKSDFLYHDEVFYRKHSDRNTNFLIFLIDLFLHHQ